MTHSYLPHTVEDRKEMLAAIGVTEAMDLFCDIPEEMRVEGLLNLPGPLSEAELAQYFKTLAAANVNLEEYACFLGAGAYDHYVPSTVDHVLRRSEFYTAYTQYQPEISQGYLQALWEYQSMICELTGMAVANASMYDGATALAEAAIMAAQATKRTEIVTLRSVHPHYREVLSTYVKDFGYSVKEVNFVDGVTAPSVLEEALDKKVGAVIIQTPNFFGCVEELAALIKVIHAVGALVIVVTDPMALGVLEAPGKVGADIVVGEGQPLGLALNFGGPYIGFLATTAKLMRKLPGRIVGQTVDSNGKRGFVLTLQAREQHIRREKATSNICSNEALCALAVAVYLATLGKKGFKEVAEQCLQKAHYAAERITNTGGGSKVFQAPFFKEFVIKVPQPVATVNDYLLKQKIIGGLDLGEYYPELAGSMLVCVTEKRTKAQIDALVAGLEACK
ncbi:MAG TPA: aminomethyl-transferring glycine dehydrogenase subunit GcvPA [Candidatus Avacidaminococcus intestinavium]|uniref:Probable glycine dehydrogenase (decarboxylating) subunit 1 n=1 Tax=Candidatus Avacidaminococcus intestinavium TaxID=2840684 RepID=A0A9D1MR63_9FIRM|nr:aminomethyl-transferring glycine dehydrogenase subunit GcvPA [Candidatus Avacidaminococcus intestinavium]